MPRNKGSDMSKRINTALAGSAFVCCLAVFSGVLYLVYIFPRTAKSWADLGRELTVLERSTAGLGNFCKQSGLFLLPLIVLLAAGSLAWLIMSLRTKRQGGDKTDEHR